MTDLLTEQAIENRKSKIDNPQHAFFIALGSLHRLSEQAVETLHALIQDPNVSPSVRLSAARTVLQMSFKAAQQFTLQPRLDQLENDLAALEANPSPEEPADRPHPHPQSKITPIPLKSSHRDPNNSPLRSDSEQNEESNAGNGSNEGSVQSTRCWWRPGKIRHTVVRKPAEVLKHSKSLQSYHLPAKVSPFPGSEATGSGVRAGG